MIEIYEDEAGEVRWRVRGTNGRIISASSEGFHDRNAAERNLEITYLALKGYYERKPSGDGE